MHIHVPAHLDAEASVGPDIGVVEEHVVQKNACAEAELDGSQ